MDLLFKPFSEIDLSDSFFDSLRTSYPEFDQWFRKKATAGDSAYVFYSKDGGVSDFLYLKLEDEEITDVLPVLPQNRRLKVGTFKLLSRGTRRGERFMKKIMDRAVAESVDEIYVTIFPTEGLQYLIKSFEKFGFVHVADKPHENNISEYVLVKNLSELTGDIIKDYPFVRTDNTNKYLLSIKPEYHTRLFPDSILNNESYDLVQDITPTNGIYKIYICWMPDVSSLKRGDIIVIYRTSDGLGSAYYRSVATSICTVLEIKDYRDFSDLNDFLNYTKYSVFSESDRQKWYQNRKDFIVIKMLYNVAFTKRVIRKDLLEKVNISSEAYWGFCPLSEDQFNKIIELGEADERYFIN